MPQKGRVLPSSVVAILSGFFSWSEIIFFEMYKKQNKQKNIFYFDDIEKNVLIFYF